jgi:citronellyl-CoA dehydrogenase
MTELEVFRQQCRAFVEESVLPRLDAWEQSGYPLRELFEALGGAGLLSQCAPVAHGGAGRPRRFNFVLHETLAELPAGALGMAVATHLDIAMPLVERFAHETVASEWLPKAIAGRAIFALALSEEQAGSDLRQINTQYRVEGDSLVVDGRKKYVTNGVVANAYCVLARRAATAGAPASAMQGYSLLFIPAALTGIQREPLDTMGNRGTVGSVGFEGVRLPRSHLLGPEGQGLLVQLKQFPFERLVIAARTVAMCRAQLQRTLAHCHKRVTYGQKLIENQHVRFRFAELFAELEALAALVESCKAQQSDNLDYTEAAAIAKWRGAQLVREVADFCLQMSGGAGYVEGHFAERMFRDGRALSLAGGTDEMMLEAIASLNL